VTATLAAALGHPFASDALLAQALTHRSFGSPHNERLEFLGDSLLNCIVAAELFARFPGVREGDLSRMRAALVREQTLHEIAIGIGLGEHLRLGEGEARSGGAARPSILADTLEALVGAVYLDAGFAAAQAMVVRLFGARFDGLALGGSDKDAKTALQELLQGRRLPLPAYRVLATHGAAHNQTFEVECAIPTLGVIALGRGASRRLAEQDAAREALAKLQTR
jgi:ribonuclease III